MQQNFPIQSALGKMITIYILSYMERSYITFSTEYIMMYNLVIAINIEYASFYTSYHPGIYCDTHAYR